MPRLVKFPLKINGVNVRSIEQLKESFSFIPVYKLYRSGKLLQWLKLFYYREELEKLQQLKGTEDNPDFPKRFCDVFGAQADVSEAWAHIRYETDIQSKLEQLGADSSVIKNAAHIAITQEDLDYLCKSGEKNIILYSGLFRIDLQYEDVNYSRIRDDAQAIIQAKDNTGLKDCGVKLNKIPFLWDVSAVSEQDKVRQAEALLLSNGWNEALQILEEYALRAHPRALILLEIYFEQDADKRAVYAKAGRALGSVQSDIDSAKDNSSLNLMRMVNAHDALGLALYGVANIKSGKTQPGIFALNIAAEKGCAWAQYKRGMSYEANGDKKTAGEWYHKAAVQGFIPAVLKMTYLASAEERQKFVETAEKAGFCAGPEALFIQAENLLKQDKFQEAVELYKQAADQGYTPALMRLGCCLLNGKGVSMDFEEGLKWLQIAANQDDAPAIFALAISYMALRTGLNSEFYHVKFEIPTRDKIRELFLKAATLEFPPAYVMLYIIYTQGKLNVDPAPPLAHRYFEKLINYNLRVNDYPLFSLYCLPREYQKTQLNMSFTEERQAEEKLRDFISHVFKFAHNTSIITTGITLKHGEVNLPYVSRLFINKPVISEKEYDLIRLYFLINGTNHELYYNIFTIKYSFSEDFSEIKIKTMIRREHHEQTD